MIRPLSPSALMTYRKSPEEFYIRYRTPSPRLEQTKPMAAGSGFDYLVKKALGWDGEAEPVSDWGLVAGSDLLTAYKQSGAFASLASMIGEAVMESSVTREVSGVLMTGKPDLFWYSNGKPIILDWKVNGYCSRASPKTGYVALYEEGKPAISHKQAMVSLVNGVPCDISTWFEGDWAIQLMTYAWLLGCEVGASPILGIIDQLACEGSVRIRTARHCRQISCDYQRLVFSWYAELAKRISEDWYFDCPIEESRIRQGQLDRAYGKRDSVYGGNTGANPFGRVL